MSYGRKNVLEKEFSRCEICIFLCEREKVSEWERKRLWNVNENATVHRQMEKVTETDDS